MEQRARLESTTNTHLPEQRPNHLNSGPEDHEHGEATTVLPDVSFSLKPKVPLKGKGNERRKVNVLKQANQQLQERGFVRRGLWDNSINLINKGHRALCMRRRSLRATELDKPTILSVPNLPGFRTKGILPVFRARTRLA
jgi:hypothetical protein